MGPAAEDAALAGEVAVIETPRTGAGLAEAKVEKATAAIEIRANILKGSNLKRSFVWTEGESEMEVVEVVNKRRS